MRAEGKARPPWEGWPACPCGCGIEGLKLQVKRSADGLFHIVGCACSSHLGRRNRKKGRAAQARAHRALGGVGVSPTHEESGRTYPVEHQLEAKKGQQIPKELRKALQGAWLRAAWQQAEQAIPAGVSAFPTVYLEPPEGGAYLVTRLPPPRGKRTSGPEGPPGP